VSIGSPSATLTNVGPVTYTVTYTGANAVTLANANVTLNKTGSANGSVIVSGSGTSTRTVTISGITGNGTLGISVAANTATDLAGNNAPAAGPSATFTIDNTPPTLSIGSPSAALTNDGPVTYTVTYTGANAVTLANGNVTLNKTGSANGTIIVSGSGTSTRTVTISNITGDGTLGISVAASTATDLAGNTAQSAGPSVTFTVDNTPPALAQIAAVPTPTNNHNPLYTFSSSNAGIIHYGGSCGSTTTAAINGSNTITLTAYGGGPFAEGTYANCTVSVTDAIGNASSPLSINAFAVQECQYQPVLILGRLLYFTSVQTAYDDANGQETVALQATDFNEKPADQPRQICNV